MTTAVLRFAPARNSRATRSRQALLARPRHVRSPMRQKYRSSTAATSTRERLLERQTAITSRMIYTLSPAAASPADSIASTVSTALARIL